MVSITTLVEAETQQDLHYIEEALDQLLLGKRLEDFLLPAIFCTVAIEKL